MYRFVSCFPLSSVTFETSSAEFAPPFASSGHSGGRVRPLAAVQAYRSPCCSANPRSSNRRCLCHGNRGGLGYASDSIAGHRQTVGATVR
jgi:hypothetical protein